MGCTHEYPCNCGVGNSGGFSLIVVLFLLLIIVGVAWC